MYAAIDFEKLEGFSRYLIVEKMDASVIKLAKDIFEKYRNDGVIFEGNFEDDKWKLTNEKKVFKLDFSLDTGKYNQNILDWSSCSCECFVECLKAYIVFKLGQVELSGIVRLLNSIKAVVQYDLEESIALCKDKSNLESFLLMIPSNNPGMGELIERMQEMKWCRPAGSASRQLADFNVYFRFDDALNTAWNSFDKKQKRHFFPVFFWWKLTAILPLRVTEFILTPRDCIQKINNEYKLTVRRTKLKKGYERIHYKVVSDYSLHTYSIPKWLGDEIADYISETENDTQAKLGTLFIPVDKKKYSYFTYSMMQKRLQEFKTSVIGDEGFPIKLGDTRHLAMINLILSGGSPVICRELAGHESIDISSNYYANLSSAVESIVYDHYHRGKGDAVMFGNTRFPVALPKDRIPVNGGWCDNGKLKNGDISECIKSYGMNTDLGDCNYCSHFYSNNNGLTLKIANQRKLELDDDSSFLIKMIELVRKGKGCEEDIASALARVQTSAYKYAKAYNKKLMEDNNNG